MDVALAGVRVVLSAVISAAAGIDPFHILRYLWPW